MPAETLHEGPSEGRYPNQESAIALGEIAVQDGADIAELSTGDNEDDEGRWDAGKAEAMAAVLQKKPEDFVRVDGDYQYVENETGKTIFEDSKWSRTRTTGYEYDDRRRGEFKDILNDPDSNDQLKERAKAYLDRFEEILDENLSPFVEYYELNPGKFAQMPTAEFMRDAKAYERACESVQEKEHGLETLTTYYIDEYKTSLEEGKGDLHVMHHLESVVRDAVDGYNLVTREFNKAHDMKTTDRTSRYFIDKLHETLEDGFNKSPRQIMESQVAILEEVTELSKKSLESEKARKQKSEDEAKSAPAE